jgi:hypothetical protein
VDAETNGSRTNTVPWASKSAGSQRQIVVPQATGFAASQPIRTKSGAQVVESIARARRWLNQLTSGEVADTKALALREGCSERSVRMTISLAFLNPDFVKAAIKDDLPSMQGVTRLADLPANWSSQISMIRSNVSHAITTETDSTELPYPQSPQNLS